LIGYLSILGSPCADAQAEQVTYESFHQTVKEGDSRTALELGRDIYTRLALQAKGQGVFYSCGLLLATVEEAANYLVTVRPDPKQADAREQLR
jgi:hypothetical protein